MSSIEEAATPMVFPPQTSSVASLMEQDSASLMSGVPAPVTPLGRYRVVPLAVISRANLAGAAAGSAAALNVRLVSSEV